MDSEEPYAGPETIDASVGEVLDGYVNAALRLGDAEERGLLQSACARATQSPSLRPGETLMIDAEAATPILEELHAEVLSRSMRTVNRFSPGRWLYYLRRLPQLFQFNDNPTTAPYCRGIAEALTSKSSKREPIQSRYPVDSRTSRHIVQLEGAIGILYELHSAYRYAGKGSPIRFELGVVPHAEPSVELQRVVQLLDKRTSVHPASALAPAGLHDVRGGWTHNPQSVPIVVDLGEYVDDLPTMFLGEPARARGRFVPRWFDLQSVSLLTDEHIPSDLRWPTSLVDALIFLSTALLPSSAQTSLLNIMWHGYVVVPGQDDVVERLNYGISTLRTQLCPFLPEERIPADGLQVFERLSNIDAQVWPPTAPSPIREDEGGCRLDYEAGKRLLFYSLQREIQGGSEVNRWSAEFELHIQRIIDKSTWEPTEQIAQVRGRHLRLDGRVIGEIDAIGEREDQILLVSCKSVPLGFKYNRGEFKRIRNVSSAANMAADRWNEFLTNLRRSPRGDNYDFGSRLIEGVVLLPFVPFQPYEHLSAKTELGLYLVSSAGEFENWIEGNQVDTDAGAT